jgi:hypothetical protein
MNKQLLVVTSLLFVATTGSAFAAPPVVSLDMAEGLLGSPVAQVPMQDPVIQKAIEWIQSKQTKPDQLQKTNPQNTIGDKRFAPRRLILGGPEIIPM